MKSKNCFLIDFIVYHKNMSLLSHSVAYKPFSYPWAYDAWQQQQRIHWLPEEVPMADDIRDWKSRLTPSEKNLCTQLFRFFTQADIEVNDCYSDDTEILTDEGWVYFKDLTQKHAVASVNTDLNIKFTKDFNIIKKYVNKELIHFYSDNCIDLLVTPTHDMVVKNVETNKISKIKAFDYRNSQNYDQPTAGLMFNNANFTVLDALRVAFQADGHKLGRKIYFHFSKERKIIRLIGLLEEAKIQYVVKKYNDKSTTISFNYEAIGNFDKDYNWIDIKNISTSWGVNFIKELKHWDGYQKENNIQVRSVNKNAIDKIQIVATLSGIKSLISDNTSYGNPHYLISLTLNKSGINTRSIKRTSVNYNGFVYCVNLYNDFGAVIVRRNNKACISGNCYMTKYSQVFAPTEIKMMLAAFSNMETIHVAAYSHLIDTLGMPEGIYEEFLHYKEMRDKYDYMHKFGVETKAGIAKTLAVFGAFTEGVQLFATFAILLNFQRFNKMKGMGQIITWSVRDESLHTASIIKLFRTFVQEEPDIWTEDLKSDIYEACATIVHFEDAFIDLAFSIGDDIQGITSREVKRYIRYIADRRLNQLGLKEIYMIEGNPLPWMDDILNGVEHTNFFENRVTEYSKAATQGQWSDVFGDSSDEIF